MKNPEVSIEDKKKNPQSKRMMGIMQRVDRSWSVQATRNATEPGILFLVPSAMNVFFFPVQVS